MLVCLCHSETFSSVPEKIKPSFIQHNGFMLVFLKTCSLFTFGWHLHPRLERPVSLKRAYAAALLI